MQQMHPGRATLHLDDAGGAQQQGEVAHLALYALEALPAEDRERVPEVRQHLASTAASQNRVGNYLSAYESRRSYTRKQHVPSVRCANLRV